MEPCSTLDPATPSLPLLSSLNHVQLNAPTSVAVFVKESPTYSHSKNTCYCSRNMVGSTTEDYEHRRETTVKARIYLRSIASCFDEEH